MSCGTLEDVDDLKMLASGRADLRGFVWADPSATSSPVLLARFLGKIIVEAAKEVGRTFSQLAELVPLR